MAKETSSVGGSVPRLYHRPSNAAKLPEGSSDGGVAVTTISTTSPSTIWVTTIVSGSVVPHAASSMLATIKRLSIEVEPLDHELNEMNIELQKRITDEMKFSEEEVKNFQEQLKSEKEELERIGRELEKVEEKLKAEEEDLAGSLKEGEEKPSTKKIKEKVAKDKSRAKKLKKEEKRETESVATLERELESEKVILSLPSSVLYSSCCPVE